MSEMEKQLVEMDDGTFLYTEFRKRKNGEDPVNGSDSGTAPALIMIPGFCCTTESFHNNAPVLSEFFDVINYDPRGQGRSSKTLAGHTVAENARDLRRIMAFFGKERYVLFAWSMAGQFVMDYIRQFGDDLIAGIIFADCPLHALGEEPWNAHGLHGFHMDHFNAHLKRSYNEWEEYCRDFARKIWGGIDDTRIEWATSQFMQTPPWIAFAIYSDMVFRNGFPWLAKTRVPMLFTGADSKVTENGAWLAAHAYPESRPSDVVSESQVFSEGGHVFFDVKAETFNAKVKEFINRHCKDI